MAMARSLAATWLTCRSPMQISPPLMVSRPAMDLSKVDLPQPEGPTSTATSPSAMSSSIDFSTAMGPKLLWTLRKETEAMGLTLDGAGGEAGDQIALQEQEEQADRDQSQHRGGHHLTPVDGEFADEGEEPDRESLLALAVDQHEAEQQFAPGGGEDESDSGAHAGQRQRQDHAPERHETRAPVDHRRLLEILGHDVEEGLHQEGRKGDIEGSIDDDEPKEAIGQAELAHDAVYRWDDHHQRKGLGQEEDQAHGCLAAEAETRQRIAGEGRDRGDDDGGRHRYQDAVEEIARKVGRLENARIVGERYAARAHAGGLAVEQVLRRHRDLDRPVDRQ